LSLVLTHIEMGCEMSYND